MAKFNIIELNISNGRLTNLADKSQNEKRTLKAGNVVYIYASTSSKKIYIEQTTQFLKRHTDHYTKDAKFRK